MWKARKTFQHKFQDATVMSRKLFAHTKHIQTGKVTEKKNIQLMTRNWMKPVLTLNIPLENLSKHRTHFNVSGFMLQVCPASKH
jgi:hypothetical protein